MKSALFAGTFDPPTFGHLNIIERASTLFDRILVGIAVNHTKNALLPPSERLQLLKALTKKWPNVEIASYSGLTTIFAKEQGITSLIRSIRSSEDWAKEWDLARSNTHLSGIETLLIPADEKYAFIRSSIVREILLNSGNTSAFIPNEVAHAYRKTSL